MMRPLLLPVVIVGAILGSSGKPGQGSGYRDRYIMANGARLYVADWGGTGPVLLFMPGFGNGAHIFDSIAPAFVDRFHVVAVTPAGGLGGAFDLGRGDYPLRRGLSEPPPRSRLSGWRVRLGGGISSLTRAEAHHRPPGVGRYNGDDVPGVETAPSR